MNELDRNRPFGTTIGDPNVFFKQDGYDFDSQGRLIPGSKNSGANAPPTEEQLYREPHEDMSIHALKKKATLLYAEFEAADMEYEAVQLGPGSKQRLIDFLNDHA